MKDTIYLGKQPRVVNSEKVEGSYQTLLGERYYVIDNHDQMPPFFMTLVSASDHWLFISSTGGLSAGRVSAETALFPYYTDDKLTENAENTGPKTLMHITRAGKTTLWEPFSQRQEGLYQLERKLYKNVLGDKLMFEEHNVELGLRYRYGWQTSERYGFVKAAWLENTSDTACDVSLLDGLQNLLPHGASTALQTNLSNLLNAYKKNELDERSGLGIFTLSSTLTDLAEPSESLKASSVWHVGLDSPRYLLSNQQLPAFRQGRLSTQETLTQETLTQETLTQETAVRGQRGAYFVQAELHLEARETCDWQLVAEVNQDSADLVSLRNTLLKDRATLARDLRADVDAGAAKLRAIIAQADGLQLTGDDLASNHHAANVLFNVMRGGIFAGQHTLYKDDFTAFVRVRNCSLITGCADFFAALPETFSHSELVERAIASGVTDLERLCLEYLPLTFSRRHGDASRPWNRFAIKLKNPDGSRRLDYEGNWRDIFQNWEPLVYSFPDFSEAVICLFLNATSADGYNPYRLTRAGMEWEKPEPDNPWANIGYWSDHQIIYLQKLLEASKALHPAALTSLLNRPVFSYANIPYRINPYADMLEDAYNTITFDSKLDEQIEDKVARLGSDGKLLHDGDGNVLYANMLEKLLLLLLVKMANFVPEGGIWMNTQRPEWNDANNALVGKGLSVVTTAYLRRFVVFVEQLVSASEVDSFTVHDEIKDFFSGMHEVLSAHQGSLTSRFDGSSRRTLMDALGALGSSYRTTIYTQGFSHQTRLTRAQLSDFLQLVQRYLEHCLRANKRSDNLYHAYNVLSLHQEQALVSHLDEMLEGQVAILSAGMLSSAEVLALLASLRQSRLYREDQHSYILYPNKTLASFLEKNRVSQAHVAKFSLITTLVERGDPSLMVKDENDDYHFNGDFKNVRSVKQTLEHLKEDADLAPLVAREGEAICQLFEDVFDHASFTGRSSTFFAYEGLGSIYWHMVSKLLLAVQECYLQAQQAGEAIETLQQLKTHYYDIRAGIGFNKSPDVYGAFPTDPYSHTPAGQGAKQPGMTGQVKEEILTRVKELGLFVQDGQLVFDVSLLQQQEWLEHPTTFHYLDVQQHAQQLGVPAGAFAYTYCQVPVVCVRAETPAIVVHFASGQPQHIAGNRLDREHSQCILQRTGEVMRLEVHVPSG